MRPTRFRIDRPRLSTFHRSRRGKNCAPMDWKSQRKTFVQRRLRATASNRIRSNVQRRERYLLPEHRAPKSRFCSSKSTPELARYRNPVVKISAVCRLPLAFRGAADMLFEAHSRNFGEDTMFKYSKLAGFVAAALFALLWAAPAEAQASRTWVSGVGDDANPCSRTAPCRTFAGAYPKTAANGEIDVLDPGSYGSVTISSRSPSMAADGSQPTQHARRQRHRHRQWRDLLTIRNLTINGVGSGLHGIRVLAGNVLHLVSTTISGDTGNGVDIEPMGSGAQVFMDNVYIRLRHDGVVKSAGGVLTQLTMDNVFLADNVNGLRVEDGGKVGVTRTTASAPTASGVSSSTASASSSRAAWSRRTTGHHLECVDGDLGHNDRATPRPASPRRRNGLHLRQ